MDIDEARYELVQLLNRHCRGRYGVGPHGMIITNGAAFLPDDQAVARLESASEELKRRYEEIDSLLSRVEGVVVR
jgi:hypothetical protein